MNRCLRPTLLALALCAALPLHASAAEASPDVDASGAERSPTELAAVRVQAGKPAADTSRANAFGGGSWKDTPASVNVPGLPPATHIAGWSGPYGLGKTWRSGMRKNSPSWL